MTCRKGHEYRGDENARARKGWCPVCHREAQARYERTGKGRARRLAYDKSEKGAERSARYIQSPKGWHKRLVDRRNHALARRRKRTWAEDQGGQ